MTLPHRLDRSLVIAAPREAVFRYFTEDALWAAWWGAGSTIDARPGGNVRIVMPGGTEVTGEVVSTAPPESIVFTYGFTSGAPIPAGSSRVTIRLDAAGAGTRLSLTHEFADAAARDHHVQGWRYQLSVFANLIANHRFEKGPDVVDPWFAAWNDTDAAARRATLAAIASDTVRMHDQHSCIDGLDELVEHIGAAQRFMPGFRMARRGTPRHCQGVVLADWEALGPDGQPRAQGTNVFTLGPDQRIATVTGFWGPGT